MPDWDEESSELHKNIKEVMSVLRDGARRREPVSVDQAKFWQSRIMQDLQVPRPAFVGGFRGESGLEEVGVVIGEACGTPPERVSTELADFERLLKAAVALLDGLVPQGQFPDADGLAAVIDICGWVHAEWIRIHPFVNGNGRTARLWANYIAMRYRLPPFVRLRPRPGGDRYSEAGRRAMQGDWQPTVDLFRRMYENFLKDSTGIL